ncbi:MAG: SDR family oxidoreductase [Actinomycetes bacterium]
MMSRPLTGQVALVAGATRGAGRAIAVELGAAGATVYCTGRSTRAAPSEIGRPETIEETASLVDAAGGTGIAVRVDHLVEAEVAALVARIASEQDGRLDVLVNDIWGSEHLSHWGPFWEQPLGDGLRMLELAVRTHLVTSWHAAPLMVTRGRGLVVEITDGDRDTYRGSLYYDLAKASVNRLALSQGADLKPHGVTAVAVTPGFLRSEQMLDHFGVTEDTWRDAVQQDEHFIASETPHYLGRAVAALAGDADVARFSGQVLSTWGLYPVYGFTDLDGRQPDWGAYFAEHRLGDSG